jgi:hypothetical protein
MNKPLKQKKCRHCKELFAPFNSMAKACSPGCALELVRSEKKVKESKVCKKAVLDLNRRDLKWQHKLTQKAFNKVRVLQELEWFKREGCDPYCISCGKINMDWCCGHFKTVGAQGVLRYDVQNTFLQCNKYCNMSLSGNIDGNSSTMGYKKGLYHRFGPNASKIIEYCETTNHVKKWEWQELESLREHLNKLARNMTKP